MENLAMRLLTWSEVQLTALGITLVVVGFLLALWLRRSATLSLPRLSYFLLWSVVFFFVSTLPFGWLLSYKAASQGILWVLSLSIFAGLFVAGFAYGILAHARSMNAYGNGGSAWMGIVPFVNLVLFFKRPVDWKRGSAGEYVLGTIVVIFGLFLVGLGKSLERKAEEQAEELARSAMDDPEMQEASTKMLLTGLGLEEALRQMAAGVPSQRVDDATNLLKVESIGSELRYIYEIRGDAKNIPISMRMNIVKNNCAYEGLRPLIEAGANIKHQYQREDGSEIGSVDVNRQLCGY